ncbi:MAG TPA: class I SAM-dependent methyltransferase [Gemmatimonadaceae bacterium]|nr:class I SAM-dependent methyltransferase [Gemmatimonadaceae bacterium]
MNAPVAQPLDARSRPSPPAEADEAERIRSAYARRRGEERYSWFEPAYLFHMQECERAMLDALRGAGVRSLAPARILEVGCGRGFWLRQLVQWGAAPERIVGIDVIPERVHEAAWRSARGVSLAVGSGASLPLPDAAFDVVLQSTVFTSILDPTLRARVAAEMRRVLRPGGLILWYDFAVDNPRNPDVRGVGRGEVHRLFPGCRVALRRVTLAPPLARRLAPRALWLCRLLTVLPPLRTHLLGTIRPQ